MAGRNKQYDEANALDRALDVFWEKGYEHASSRDLQTAMGIGKGSFYLAFKDGKQELFLKSLERFFALYAGPFLSQLLSNTTPLEAIRQYYYVLADPQGQFGRLGCYFGNTLMQPEDQHLKTVAGGYIVRVAEAFTIALRQAPNAAQVSQRLDPSLWSLYFVTLWNGLNATRLVEPDPTKLKQLIDFHLRVFE